MKAAMIRQRIKPWVLPFAMVIGALFHSWIDALQWTVPYFIFCMLFITFCRVRPSDLRITRMMWYLVGVQIVGSIALFWLLKPLGLSLAQGVFICVLCPTATAAPVVTGMLGGSIATVATYSIISNLCVALLAPALFVWVGNMAEISFVSEFCLIGSKVAPLIVFPLAAAFLLYFFARPVHDAVDKAQGVSFYLWAISLIIVVGRAVSFIMSEPAGAIPLMTAIALLAGLVCIVQFVIGRKIGARYGDKVSAAQGLGQKNTVLAIWMALTYLEPLSSIGPAAYIVWQNAINSAQLYYHMKRQASR